MLTIITTVVRYFKTRITESDNLSCMFSTKNPIGINNKLIPINIDKNINNLALNCVRYFIQNNQTVEMNTDIKEIIATTNTGIALKIQFGFSYYYREKK